MKFAEAFVELRADNKKLLGSMKQGEKIVQSGTGRMAALAKRAGALIGAYLGIRVLLAFGRSIIQLAGEQEEANLQLAQSLRMIGEYSDTTFQDLRRFAAGIQNVTVYGDESVQALMSMGAALGKLSGKALKEATVAAIGWAEIIGVDVKAAMNMIARAAQGNFALWSRYTTELAKFNTAQEKMAFLMRAGAKGFEIQKAKASGTKGMIEQFKNAWGDAKERMGEAFKEGAKLNDMLADMKRGIDGTSKKMSLLIDLTWGVGAAFSKLKDMGTGVLLVFKTVATTLAHIGLGIIQVGHVAAKVTGEIEARVGLTKETREAGRKRAERAEEEIAVGDAAIESLWAEHNKVWKKFLLKAPAAPPPPIPPPPKIAPPEEGAGVARGPVGTVVGGALGGWRGSRLSIGGFGNGRPGGAEGGMQPGLPVGMASAPVVKEGPTKSLQEREVIALEKIEGHTKQPQIATLG